METNLILGDCLDKLKDLEDDSVDSIVTDSPYGLSFMGQKWDYDVPSIDIWKECLRVLKPGGHLLSFSGSRTYHRMAVNIEDAGFEIRDQIMWVYGSGFPKSHNLKDEWEGWGTALKPAHEPIVLARKPFKGTVANNVSIYGTGALNINGCRVNNENNKESQGRWTANFIHDGSEEVLELFPNNKSSSGGFAGLQDKYVGGKIINKVPRTGYDDEGSAARFFYCSKANKRDRNEGCEDLELKPAGSMDANNPLCGSGPIAGAKPVYAHNNHPTVKPTDLMRYLCRLVTPKNGTVLDPFMGSGSTGKAAILEGFSFIGIEMSEEYMKIAEKRINFAITNNE